MDKILEFSKKHILNLNRSDLISIDATLGRGNDTLFLSKISKKVYSFDIQKEAIEYSLDLLSKNNISNVEVILDSHENITKYVNACDVVMFNLGYLPKGDKSIATRKDSTLKAIKESLSVLNLNGIISIVFYPGFPSGLEESEYVMEYLKTLDQKTYDIIKYEFINQINMPPFCVLIERIK